MNEQAQAPQAEKAVPSISASELRYWAARGIFARIQETGDESDAPLGTKLLFQAAQMGNAKAKVLTASFIINGAFGITPDREKGETLLREAVADGCEEAEVALARLYYESRLPKNEEVYFRLARKLWVERKDYVAAHRIMSRAARMGYVPAMKDLAQMIREGVGCEKDEHLAADIEWQAEELAKGKEGK